MPEIHDTAEDAYEFCPLSRADKKLLHGSGRRCIVDDKPCYTPYMWLFRVCDLAKKQRQLK